MLSSKTTFAGRGGPDPANMLGGISALTGLGEAFLVDFFFFLDMPT